MLSYWSFSFAFARISSSSLFEISLSLSEIFSLSFPSHLPDYSVDWQEMSSHSRQFFLVLQLFCFFFVSSISVAYAGMNIPHVNAIVSRRLIIFFLFIICRSFPDQKHYTFKCLRIVKKLPTKPIPTPKAIPIGSNVL